jgi:hypothetical protein
MGMRTVNFALLAACGLLASCASSKPQPDSLPKTRVVDLHYGDVLFQNFIGEDFEALTRLEAYQHWGLMPNHASEADLLAGGLYLQLGMHNEAGRRFQTLLGPEVPAGIRGRAWFYLGQVWYARGYYDRTVEALSRIDAPLQPAMEAEKVQLLSNALMHLGRYDEAIRQLEGWRGSNVWTVYARFNLGVALLRGNRLEEGARLLDQIGQIRTSDEEMLALRDKANLALGFAWLQDKQPARARAALERVRLDGAQSSRALLGLGWADVELGQYESALTPWLELRERNLLDAAVQEAYLAVPYAFAKLGANSQAAEYYEQALTSFDRETGRIDESIGRISEGRLMQNLLGEPDGKAPQRGWFWQLRDLPDAPESRYLYPIFAGNDFQEGLKNFRDLSYLGATLERWDENMVVYSDMIETREQAYAERMPRVDALLAGDAVSQLEARRKDIEDRFNAAVTGEDFAAFGTAEQREQWRRIEVIETAIAADPDNPELAELKDKLRLVRGVLLWDLKQGANASIYAQRRELKSLDRALEEANSRWLRVEQARASAPTTTGDFALRIAALQQRMTGLRAQLAQASAGQQQLLSDIAIAELEAQKQRISDYEVQTRFALATIYDRAAEAPK